MSIVRLWTLAFVASAIALAGSTQAAPVLYQFTSGQATITVTTGSTTLTALPPAFPPILTLNGIFAVFDEVTPALTNFEFTTAPDQMILLTQPYGFYDEIIVNSASMIPGPGYTHYGTSNDGGGNYQVAVAPVRVNGVYSASFSGGPPPLPMNNVPITFDNGPTAPLPTPPLLAVINVIAGTFRLAGITLGVIQLPPEFNEPVPLVVKADLTFQGMVPVSTPEPGALVLVGLGLSILAGLRLRRI